MCALTYFIRLIRTTRNARGYSLNSKFKFRQLARNKTFFYILCNVSIDCGNNCNSDSKLTLEPFYCCIKTTYYVLNFLRTYSEIEVN